MKIELVLEECNKIRELFSFPAVDKIEKGILGIPTACPISKTIKKGSKDLRVYSTINAILITGPGKFKEITTPTVLRNFIHYFGQEEFPEFML